MKKVRSFFRKALCIVGLVIVLFVLVVIMGRAFYTQKYKIRSKEGIQKSEFASIGGIEQYIQIRGQNRSNPIMVVLHGGPGSSMAYYSYHWQADLEQEYTIVHWDQRGCGNTYYQNQNAEKPTLNLLLSDLNQLVDYLRTEFRQEKVVIMGHSWGTFLGGIYAVRYPDKVSAYVGVSQFTDVWKSEQHAAAEAIRSADTKGKSKDAKKIEEQFQRVMKEPQLDMKEFMKLRQLTAMYLLSDSNVQLVESLFSPYMTFRDLKWFFFPMLHFDQLIEIQGKLYETLAPEKGLTMYQYTQFEVPVVIISGERDWITPHSLAQEYYDSVSAPQKQYIQIKDAGHIPFMDRPEVFNKELKKVLNEL